MVSERAALVLVRNGTVVRAEVDPGVAARGVTVGSGIDDEASFAASPPAVDAFGHLHDAFVADVLVVDVPPGVALTAPVVVLHVLDTEGAAAFPHTVVRTGEGAEVTVLEYVTSADVACLSVPVVELHAAAASNLRHLTVQDLGTEAWQIAEVACTAGRDATVAASTVALGGAYARQRTAAVLREQGGTVDLAAVYFSDGDQQHDFRTLQDHLGPRTTSHLLFKGAVGGRAHSVYTGMIRVRQGASQADAFLANRNLVLAEGARVDSVPNLEIINENDIRNCGHASATGPIDEEHRFYLESRGVPADVAERLIVLGFFDDVIARTPVPPLRPLLRAAVARKLDAVAPVGSSRG